MRIGIDIDDTVSLTYSKLMELALDYDKEHVNGKGFKNKNAYRYVDRFYWSKDNVNDFFKGLDRSVLYANLDVIDDSLKIVNQLYEDGHEIIFITRRNVDSYNVTRQWLLQKGFKFHQLYLGISNKGKFCCDNDISFFIDNEEVNVRDALKYNIDAVLFGTLQNEDINDLKRIESWNEIYRYINEVK